MKSPFWLGLGFAIVVAASIAGCSSTSVNARAELPTSSDQTDGQKRAYIRLQLAVGYYEQRQLPVALDEIKQALQAYPDLTDAYGLRALIYMDLGEMRLAEENFARAMKLMPDNAELSNNYGWFLCQTGRMAQAIPYFDAALKNPAYRSPAKAANNAGVCSLRLNDRGMAERYFAQAFHFEPSNSLVNVNLADLYYRKGDIERANFYIERVAKQDKTVASTLWLAIKIAHKLGDRLTEAKLAAQLQRLHPQSIEYAAYQRKAFDD